MYFFLLLSEGSLLSAFFCFPGCWGDLSWLSLPWLVFSGQKAGVGKASCLFLSAFPRSDARRGSHVRGDWAWWEDICLFLTYKVLRKALEVEITKAPCYLVFLFFLGPQRTILPSPLACWGSYMSGFGQRVVANAIMCHFWAKAQGMKTWDLHDLASSLCLEMSEAPSETYLRCWVTALVTVALESTAPQWILQKWEINSYGMKALKFRDYFLLPHNLVDSDQESLFRKVWNGKHSMLPTKYHKILPDKILLSYYGRPKPEVGDERKGSDESK